MAIILALCFSSFFSLHVLNFRTRNDTYREVWDALPLWKPLETLELRLYDQRFTTRGARQPLSHDKIVVVGIDQVSLTRFGQWPIPRSFYATVIDRLKAAGAKVIAVDLDFSDYRNPHFDAQHNVVLSSEDRALVAASARAKNVLFPSYLSFDRKTDSHGKKADSVNFLQSPIDQLDSLTPDLALAFLPVDTDGGTRRYPWMTVINPGGASEAVIGSLAGLAVAKYENNLDGNQNKAYETQLKSELNVAASKRMREVPLLYSRPANSVAPHISTMLINYWGPETFANYSMSDLIFSKESAYSAANLRKIFGGKIVFVGATAHILKDEFPMPLFSITSRERGIDEEESLIPGVELHATAAAMMLDGTFIRPASTSATLVWVFGLTLIAGLTTASLREVINRVARGVSLWWIERGGHLRLHDPLWITLYTAVAVLPIAAYWYLAVWFFDYENLWLVFVYPGLSAGLTSAGVMLYSFGSEAAERRKALAQFSRLVSPEVMEEILAHPEEEYPRPRRVHATVLFSDLEGFTTYSEKHEPEQVVDAINSLFGRLEPVVHSYGGTVDKYIGDAIMAFFGAPVPRWDHAARALHCAVAMQNECQNFREETGILFYMRVGVHTGDVIVGCVGSDSRSDYTMIGDTVNLAARLEGKNKEFGSWIMCSSATFDAAPEVAIVESASAQIKGKSNAVEVFIVRGLKGEPVSDTQWGRGLRGSELADENQLRNDVKHGSQGALHVASEAGAQEALAALPSPSLDHIPDRASSSEIGPHVPLTLHTDANRGALLTDRAVENTKESAGTSS